MGPVRVPMADLRELFAAVGMPGARTVLNTGNVVFESGRADGPLRALLERELSGRFDYDARVFLRRADEVPLIADSCPFEELEDHHRYAVVCSDGDVARKLAAHAVELGPGEARAAGDGVVYWRVARGSTLDSPFGKLLASREFAREVTNRNLNTMQRIATLVETA